MEQAFARFRLWNRILEHETQRPVRSSARFHNTWHVTTLFRTHTLRAGLRSKTWTHHHRKSYRSRKLTNTSPRSVWCAGEPTIVTCNWVPSFREAGDRHQTFDLGSLLGKLPGRMGTSAQAVCNAVLWVTMFLCLVSYVVVITDSVQACRKLPARKDRVACHLGLPGVADKPLKRRLLQSISVHFRAVSFSVGFVCVHISLVSWCRFHPSTLASTCYCCLL